MDQELITGERKQELLQLAKDVHAGKVWLGVDQKALDSFPILKLMDKEQYQEFLDRKPGLVYEYLDKAGPMAVNGNPRFFSMRVLTEGEVILAQEYLDKVRTADQLVTV